jgi:hypothetical protein
VLTTCSIHRNYTSSWTEQTRYWTILRRGSRLSSRHISKCSRYVIPVTR